MLNDFRKFVSEKTVAYGYNNSQTNMFDYIELGTSDEMYDFFAMLLKPVSNCRIDGGARSVRQKTEEVYKACNFVVELTTNANNRVSLNRVIGILKIHNIKYERVDINKIFIEKQVIEFEDKRYKLLFNVIIRGHSVKGSLTDMIYNDMTVSVSKTDLQETIQLCSIIAHLNIDIDKISFSHPKKNEFKLLV